MRVAGAQEKLGRQADAVSAYAEVVRVYPEQRAEVAIAQERLTALRRTSRMNGAPAAAIAPGDVSSVTRPVFDSYCISCHSAANRTAGLSLDALSRAPVGENLALWEKVTRRLQARLDPPRGAPRPDDATYRAVVSRLEQALDAAHAANRTMLPVEPVTDTELAARMAAFLWNDAPDAELFEAARRGESPRSRPG